MRHLHLRALQGPHQLVLVVAGHGKGVAGLDHSHRQPQHPRGIRAPVDQIAQEDHPPPGRVGRVDRPPGVVASEQVAQPLQQRLEFGPAAVHIADDVERPVLVAKVVQQRLPDDARPRRSRPRIAARAPCGSPPWPARAASGAAHRVAAGRRAHRTPGRRGSGCVPGTPLRAHRARWRPEGRRAPSPVRPPAAGSRVARWSRR